MVSQQRKPLGKGEQGVRRNVVLMPPKRSTEPREWVITAERDGDRFIRFAGNVDRTEGMTSDEADYWLRWLSRNEPEGKPRKELFIDSTPNVEISREGEAFEVCIDGRVVGSYSRLDSGEWLVRRNGKRWRRKFDSETDAKDYLCKGRGGACAK